MFPLLLRVVLLIAQSQYPAPLGIATSDPVELELDARARQYRIETYNAYRANRAELDLHRALWDEARSRWRAAGSRNENRAALVTWLDAATDAVRNRQAPPPLPEFGPDDAQLSQSPSSKEIAAPRPSPVRRQAAAHPSDANRPKLTFKLGAPKTSQPARPTKLQSVVKNSEPRVNLGELQVRVAGFQVGMQTVNSVLHNEEPLNVRQLSTLLDELESLLITRSDLLLYHDLTPVEERTRIDQLLKYPQQTIEKFRSRVAGLRDQLVLDTDLPASDRAVYESSLDKLSDRLVNLPEN
jgi:hypothetical protein